MPPNESTDEKEERDSGRHECTPARLRRGGRIGRRTGGSWVRVVAGGFGRLRIECSGQAPTVEHQALFATNDVGGEGGVGKSDEGGDERTGADGDLSEADDGVARVGGGRVFSGVGEGALGVVETAANEGEIAGAKAGRRGGAAPRPRDAGAVGAPLRRQKNAAEMGHEQRPILVDGAVGDRRKSRGAAGEAKRNRGGAIAGRWAAHGVTPAAAVSSVARGQE